MKKAQSRNEIILREQIKRKDSNLAENEITQVVGGLQRFVRLVQKIYTQPQSSLKLVDVLDGKKVIRKDLLITTTIEEIAKTKYGNKSTPLLQGLRETWKIATKGKVKNGN